MLKTPFFDENIEMSDFMEAFKALNISNAILKSVMSMGYENPTDIQVQAIPLLLEGKDLLGSAQTGTGKTAAFAIPILQMLESARKPQEKREIKALVLTPTRELANQIYDNFNQYAKYLSTRTTVIYGGVSQRRQEGELARGTDVLVATPGRLLDLMNQGIISLTKVEYLVLDEADQMLDMGFIKDVYKIIKYIPKERQTMLFSATMPKSIEALAKDILNDPIRIAVTPVAQTLDVITQELYQVSKAQKAMLLIHLIHEKNMNSVLVFTKTKHGANKVAKDLLAAGMTAEPIHGNKSQAARERALLNFKKGKTRVLVATDIAARGLDIDKLSYVFNFDLPDTPETYIHRIGRTGRAGKSGVSISFCDKTEVNLLKDIEKHIKQIVPIVEEHPYKLKDMTPPDKGQEKQRFDKKRKIHNQDNQKRYSAKSKSNSNLTQNKTSSKKSSEAKVDKFYQDFGKKKNKSAYKSKSR